MVVRILAWLALVFGAAITVESVFVAHHPNWVWVLVFILGIAYFATPRRSGVPLRPTLALNVAARNTSPGKCKGALHRAARTIAVVAFMACPWSPPRGSFHEAIERAKRSGEATVRLTVSDRAWTTAYFFGPYTPNGEIDRVLGFNCDPCHLLRLDRRDDLNAIVLASGKELIQVQELPRSAGDIRPGLLERPYSPNTIFTLARDATGRVWVESVQGSS